ncbi:transmembrane hyphal anastomosis protein ham2 far11 [Phlyctema vagabunda]|uniref:Transmembrane hyphal anastomosis protein ham2 far11 n=1 Tax=Phlyctema vagabunda TaxID=108571 RepID=A0ABR4PGG4_9HELO
MASLWSKPAPEAPNPEKDISDVADTGLADVGLPAPQPLTSVPMGRPMLQRNQPQPPPPHQPPPPPSPQQVGNAQDSLSLMQLKRIVTDFPRIDPTLYAFDYGDTASYEEEVDEWFSYNDAEFKRLARARETFNRRWNKVAKKPWPEAETQQAGFLQREISGLAAADLRRRCKSLQTVLHVALGVWDESAGLSDPGSESDAKKRKTKATTSQTDAMATGIMMIAKADGIQLLFEVMQNAFKRLWDDDYRNSKLLEEDIPFIQDELDNVTTILYVIIEGVRHDAENQQLALGKLLALEPGLVNYFLMITARLRWDEANELPQTRIFLLFWKSVLLIFGGTAEVDRIKRATKEKTDINGSTEKLITASPLDYHIFRQEITSKYPAYVPPRPLIPLEQDNNSILPPLPHRPSRRNGENGILPAPIGVNTSGASILHQPVHIATPAPSPPPSPPVGGKAGKKQNYQTNQNFPFMYPPLDSTSNSAGGKGAAGLQEFLVGRKWEGSDIPASILEAGELFAKRMRMTRPMRQLWDERERFLRFERGWEDRDEDIIEELDLESILAQKFSLQESKPPPLEADYGPEPSTVDSDVKKRLDDIEAFYGDSVPYLQSLVIVLLKAILANVTALLSQPMGQPGGIGSAYRSETNLRAAQGQSRAQDPAHVPLPNDFANIPVEEVEATRSREITAKAVSGILLILLKWFKVSHVLKFEYLTQLLLDSNYLPLVLKLFAHQEIEKVVVSKADREDLSFFSFCNTNSIHAPQIDDESDDDAVPPPIKLDRGSGSHDQLPALAFQEGQHAARREHPEVDEMGYPINDVPTEPITDFSWRNFYSTINLLRIMQKICKNKAHRNLLLVQYKSSNILKKSLKIPQPELRLYTLKLFKNQVPYCGRKWRQGNMRVITAVYLHCRPELRDDWLAGSDVDAEVEEALPLEQALRSLTHWYNIKRYPAQMGADTKLLEEEHDFFIREIEKMEFIEDSILDESVADSGWEGPGNY